MSNINSVSGSSDILSQYAIADKPKQKANELGKTEFLELMIAQMNNQSPLEPQDNGQFISQLAQFSSLEGIQELNSTVSSVAGQYRSAQALQASAMVGRSVYVPGTEAPTDAAGGMTGFIDLPGSTSSVKLSVLNESGELVNQVNLGSQSEGEVKFAWDGTNAVGEQMPPGKYTVKAEASYDGANQQVQTFLKSNVDSVSIGKDGALTLNLAGRGSVSMKDVRQIN
jgi:flagellar basal-body rod modification protein FlgD